MSPAPGRSRALALLSSVAALALVGCGGGDGDADDGGVFSSLLAAAPSLDDAFVMIGDLAGAAEAVGIERPTGDGDDAVEYLLTMSGLRDQPVGIRFPPMFDTTVPLIETGEFESTFGFSIGEIDAFVEVSAPPQGITIFAGDFDIERIADVVLEAGAETAEHDSTTYYTLGEDGAPDLSNANNGYMGRLGQGTAVVPLDGHLAIVRPFGLVAGVIDAIEGDEAGTLADDLGDDAIAGLDALHTDGARSAVVTTDSSAFETGAFLLGPNMTPESVEQTAQQLEDEPALPRWSSLVVAEGPVDGTPTMFLQIGFASAESASEAAPTLRAVLADGTEMLTGEPFAGNFHDPAAEADGSVVHATATLDVAGRSPNLLVARSNLFRWS